MLKIQSTGTIYGENVTVKQISKIAASKLFAEGKEVYLQSSNMRPFNMWQSLCPVKLDLDQLNADIKHNQFCIELYENVEKFSPIEWYNELVEDYKAKVIAHKEKVINAFTQFDSICNNYKYYNCDSERGNYIHFYTAL